MTHTHTRSGSALVLVAVTMILLLSLATVLTERTVSGLKDETRRKEDLMLMMASESAANEALAYLQSNYQLLEDRKLAGQIDATPAVVDGGDVDITASIKTRKVNGRPLTAHWSYLGQRSVVKDRDPVTGVSRFNVVPVGTLNSVVQDVYLVTATATMGRDDSGAVVDANRLATRRVQLLFVPYPQDVFVRAMFAHNGFDFQGAAATDSWDSATGGYAGVLGGQGKKGDIAAEGDIDVLKPGNVYGAINPDISFPLPPVDYAPTAAYLSPDALTTSKTLTTGSYRAKYVSIGGSDTLTIDGKVTLYVDGPVNLVTKSSGANATGNVVKYADADSRLTIIQGDYDATSGDWPSGLESSFDINAGDVMGDPANPSRFLIISEYSGEMKLNGNAEFGGVLYAPNATVQMNGTFDFCGSIIADTFASKPLGGGAEEMGKVNGNFTFHYDEQLANLRLPLPPRLGVVGWYTQVPRN
jgi:hypothetical protein